jgi:hypothetical protein
MPWPQGPMHRRAQWPGYRPARSGLSTPIVKKLSYRSQVFCDAKKSLCFGPLAALEPHSCDVLTITYALNRRRRWGCRRSATRDRRSRGTRRLSHAARKLREICSPLTFETVAGLLLASDSRISMRAATPCSGIVPLKERKRRVWIGRRSCRMLMEFGGTQG